LLAAEIAGLSMVERVSASSDNLGRNASGTTHVKNISGDQPHAMNYYDVDENFIANMQLKLLTGNNFPGNNNSYEQYVLINENARHALHFNSDAEAVNKLIWLDDSTQVQIAGVVKDFYYSGADAPIRPLVFRNRMNKFNVLNIKTKNESKDVTAAIASVWKKFSPGKEVHYEWLKEKYNSRLGAGNTFSMLGFLALIAVTLACLGLLGIVTYAIEMRRKEIGIRKIMGANVSTIITMLSAGFLKLVLIAGCIALPVSYILGYIFLNMFANRISLGIAVQLFSLLALLFIALLTMGSQIFRVATANPVEALRNE
jgi:putative ABC transport system permease protein